MSFRPPASPGRPSAPVRSVRPNTWLLVFTAGDRAVAGVRCRHGRARWCLGAGMRRRPVVRRLGVPDRV
jgi:hypothetical protein